MFIERRTPSQMRFVSKSVWIAQVVEVGGGVADGFWRTRSRSRGRRNGRLKMGQRPPDESRFGGESTGGEGTLQVLVLQTSEVKPSRRNAG